MSINGVPFFVVMRRGETMQERCLHCHGAPAEAPKGLLALYGSTRSFGHRQGEAASAVSIRIPLAEAYSDADRISWSLSGLLVLGLFIISLIQYWLNRYLIISPLTSIQDKALLIAEHEEHLGERIEISSSREFEGLAQAFSTMSDSLRQQRDVLDEKVLERTKELSEAMANIKTLNGLLPICASCKKIRDDQGYWNQLEMYIQDHTDAAFSHSICPDCIRRLYPELLDDEEHSGPGGG